MTSKTASQDSSPLRRHYAKRSILFLDRICLVIGFLTVAFTLGNLLYGYYWLATITATASIITFAIRDLNQRGRHQLAARMTIVTMNSALFVAASMFGKRYLIQNLFFPSVALPILISSHLSIMWVTVGVTLPIAFYFLLEYTSYALLGTAAHATASFWRPGANATLCFAFCFLFAFEFYRITRQSEEHIQLEQSKLLAASKLSALGEMAGGIAHEINNPLSSILLLSAHIRTLASKPEIPGKHCSKPRRTSRPPSNASRVSSARSILSCATPNTIR